MPGSLDAVHRRWGLPLVLLLNDPLLEDVDRVEKDDGKLGTREALRLFLVASLLAILLCVSAFSLVPQGLKAADWTFQCADGRSAHIERGKSWDEVRLVIDRQVKPDDWSIILQRHDRIDDRSTRILQFEARADAERDVICIVRDFAPPWENFGLYEKIRLRPEWKRFEFAFNPPSASSMAAIEWLVGSSTIPIEVRDYSLTRLPAKADRSERPSGDGSRMGGL